MSSLEICHVNNLKSYLIYVAITMIFFAYNNQKAQIQDNVWVSKPTASVNQVCWSPDGQRIASVGFSRVVMIWNSTTGENITNLLGHTPLYPSITSVSWSHHGDRIVSGTYKEIIIWDAYSYKLITKISIGTSWVLSLKWSPDDSMVAFDSDGIIYIINSTNGSIIASFSLDIANLVGGISAVCWINDSLVIAGSVDGELTVFDVKSKVVTNTLRYFKNGYGIYGIEVSPDGKLASLVSYCYLYLIDTKNFQLIDHIKVSHDYLWSSSWSPDGNFITASGNWSRIRIYNSKTKQVTGIIPFPSDTIQAANYSLVWSPDGSKILVGSQLPDQSGRVSIWNGKMGITNVADSRSNGVLVSYLLGQNYPNPFNPTTTIEYQLPKQTKVVLKVLDLLGREVETLVDEEKDVGSYSVKFDGSNYSSGVYFYQLIAGNNVITKKFVLMK